MKDAFGNQQHPAPRGIALRMAAWWYRAIPVNASASSQRTYFLAASTAFRSRFFPSGVEAVAAASLR